MSVALRSVALAVLVFLTTTNPLSAEDAVAEDTARGSITVGGLTVPLRHAYLCTRGGTDLIEICLTGKPATYAILDNWRARVQSARNGNPIVWVRIHRGRANLVEVYEGRTERGYVEVVDPEGTSEVRLTGAEVAEGLLNLRGQAHNGPIALDVRFVAHPAPKSGISRVFDALLERFPFLGTATHWVLNRAFPFLVAGAVLIPIGALCYWAFVVVPRRAARWFDGLERSGWTRKANDDPALNTAIQSLVPRYRGMRPVPGSDPGDPKPRRAVARVSRSGTRYVARARQWAVEIAAGSSTRRTNARHTFFVIAEPRPIPIVSEMSITQRSAKWDEQVAPGVDPEFARLYEVTAHDEGRVVVPAPLQRAFLELVPFLAVTRGKPATQWLVHVSTRFGPGGWGLSCGQLTTQAALDSMLDVAERLSTAVDAC